MLTRHDNIFMGRLEDAHANGYSHITWDELYAWYKADRLGKQFWRDLKSRWEEIRTDSGNELRLFETRGGLGLIGIPNSKIHVLPDVPKQQQITFTPWGI